MSKGWLLPMSSRHPRRIKHTTRAVGTMVPKEPQTRIAEENRHNEKAMSWKKSSSMDELEES